MTSEISLGLIGDHQKAEKEVQIDRKRRRINGLWFALGAHV
jgi:hypothetical protein